MLEDENDYRNQQIAVELMIRGLKQLGCKFIGLNDDLMKMKFDIPEDSVLYDNKEMLSFYSWNVKRLTPYQLAVRKVPNKSTDNKKSATTETIAFEKEIKLMFQDIFNEIAKIAGADHSVDIMNDEGYITLMNEALNSIGGMSIKNISDRLAMGLINGDSIESQLEEIKNVILRMKGL